MTICILVLLVLVLLELTDWVPSKCHWIFHCNLIDMTPDLRIVFFVFLLITGIALRALGGGGS